MTLRLKPGDSIIIASHNEGKVRELAELFAPFRIACVSAASLGLAEPEETGKSFAENAALKAVAAARAAGKPALSDDSGLEVEALGGAPGIHSARWGGKSKDFGKAMDRVHRELAAIHAAKARANFTCALALAAPDGTVRVFEGKVFGTLTSPPRGLRGFGYDPIFVPDGYTETFGEMEPALKNKLSHRMRAFEQLMAEVYADET
ncbi:MAG TPA: RdgB/HAM1 family non-canonical purine NTP pyrophosphatase [Methyloceanibacter sp.]|nr:RdgB/HAM1 family non-canonical purine NTP pyrophosphatase [Methyloceanibacter sp.]